MGAQADSDDMLRCIAEPPSPCTMTSACEGLTRDYVSHERSGFGNYFSGGCCVCVFMPGRTELCAAWVENKWVLGGGSSWRSRRSGRLNTSWIVPTWTQLVDGDLFDVDAHWRAAYLTTLHGADLVEAERLDTEDLRWWSAKRVRLALPPER